MQRAAAFQSNPCTGNEQSSNCKFHIDYMDMHEDLWRDAFGQTYIDGVSHISISPPPTGPDDPWELKVWQDAGLDYSDPNLTQQEVDAQVVAEGTFDFAASRLLAEVEEQGTVDNSTETYTQTVSFWASSGILLGSNQTSHPMAVIVTSTHVAYSSGGSVSVHHLSLVKTDISLREATGITLDIAQAVEQDPANLEVPEPPANQNPLKCFHAANAEMSTACCWCFADRAACYSGCKGVFWAEFADCLPSWESILSGFSCAACFGLIKSGSGTTPIGQAAILATCLACVAGLIYTVIRCYVLAKGKQKQCEADCDRDWLECLRSNGCAIPEF